MIEIGRDAGRRKYFCRLGENLLRRISPRNMGQDEPFHAARGGEGSGLCGRDMAVVPRDGSITRKEGRLDHQGIRVARVVAQSLGRLRIAHDDELFRTFGRPENVLWLDRPAIGQYHRPSFSELSADRAVRNAERRQAVRLEMPARSAREDEAKTVRVAMADREACDGEIALVDDLIRRDGDELERDWRRAIAEDPGKHAGDEREGARTAVNRHDVRDILETERGKKAGNAEHVIEMRVGEQEPFRAPDAHAAAQQLALRSLAAIDEDALAARHDEQVRMIALG